MDIINNFSEIFLSVWNKGILGVDIFQILKISTPRIPLFKTDKHISEKLFIITMAKFYITKTPLLQD